MEGICGFIKFIRARIAQFHAQAKCRQHLVPQIDTPLAWNCFWKHAQLLTPAKGLNAEAGEAEHFEGRKPRGQSVILRGKSPWVGRANHSKPASMSVLFGQVTESHGPFRIN